MSSLLPAPRSCPRSLSRSGLPHPYSFSSLAFRRTWHHLIRTWGEEHPTRNTCLPVGDQRAFISSEESLEAEGMENGKNKRVQGGNLVRGVRAGGESAKVGMPMWGKLLSPLQRGPSPQPQDSGNNRNRRGKEY